MSKITNEDLQEMREIIASGKSLAFNSIGMRFSWLITNEEYHIADKTHPIENFSEGAEIISLVDDVDVNPKELSDKFKGKVNQNEQMHLHLGAF